MKISIALFLELLFLLGTAAIEPQPRFAGPSTPTGQDSQEHEANPQKLLLDFLDNPGTRADPKKTKQELEQLERTAQPRNLQQNTSWCSSVILDFDTAGDGSDLVGGNYVANKEWRNAYGLRVFANGRGDTGYTPLHMPRLLDSDNAGGTFTSHLGSPNRMCDPRGLRGRGEGSGGAPGQPGENCEPLGIVLLIQENDMTDVKNNPQGGVITFAFDRPTDVTSVGVLDSNTTASKIYVTRENGSRRTIRIPHLGVNSVQTVPIYQRNALKVQVSFRYTGALTHLTFCPPTTPAPSPRPTIARGCVPSKKVHVDDFEGPNPLQGWVNGRIDFDPGFTKFLGRFIKHDAVPSKDYLVNPQADSVVVEFDFYEIDSWNGANGARRASGPDRIYPKIDGEELDIGIFRVLHDEGTRNGTSPNGISWMSRSQRRAGPIGFGEGRFNFDQIHHITAVVPKRFYEDDGLIKVSFRIQVTATSVNDESAGYDNIVITEEYICDATVRPTPSPACQPTIVGSEEDFQDRSLAGWTNGKLASNPGFTTFLGRFVKGDPDPFKTYHVETNAYAVVVEFDFYEIDSWNSGFIHGRDKLFVSIDGEVLDLGIFNNKRDEGVKQSSTPNGIVWERRSQGPPSYIGFRGIEKTYFRDQIHHVTATVPPLFFRRDGQLTLTFQTRVTATRETDESSGFDNIVVTSKFDCGGSPSRTPRPTAQPTTNTTGSICGTLSVGGSSSDAQGTPIYGIRVRVDRMEPWIITNLDFSLTSQEGQYCVSDLPLGLYRVSVKHGSNFISPPLGERLVTIGFGQPVVSTGNDFVVEPFRTIAGVVLADSNFHDVAGPFDAVIPSFALVVTGTTNDVRRNITTDVDGRFESVHLPGGEYLVRSDSYVDFDGSTYVSTADPNGIKVDLAAGDATDLIVLMAMFSPPPPPHLSQRRGSICGNIHVGRDNNGQPGGFERGFVRFVALHRPPPFYNQLETSAPSVRNGRYCFNDVRRGDYTIVANLHRRVRFVSPTNGEIGVRIEFGLPFDSRGNDFIVEQFRYISGTIVVDADGDGIGDTEFAVPGAFVSLKLIGPTVRFGQTTNFGNFIFVDVPPGEYTVRIEGIFVPDGSVYSVVGDLNGTKADVTRNDQRDLDFVLRRR